MQVGRYRLIDRIGAGGMAEVFLAQQDGPEGFARRVALKFVRPDLDDPDALLSLIDEARVAAQLSHPNIVQVTELERYGDGFYLVMEFLRGWPLDRLMKMARTDGPAPTLPVVVDIGLQLVDALKYAHSARGHDGSPLRVVHRDIKPGNVIVDGLGLVKLVDFGIARAESIERRTATGIGKGTPAYMAPEQLRGEEVSPASDLFAVGVLLVELALGRRLFTADNFLALITRRTEGFTDQDRADLTGVLPELVPIAERALRDEPSERYPDADSMAAALREVVAVQRRDPVHKWLEQLLGDDPADLLAASSAGAWAIEPVEAEATKEVGSEWIEQVDDSSVPPTRLVDPGVDASIVDDDDPAMVTTKRWRRPAPGAIVALVAVWALLGWGVWMLWPEAPAEADGAEAEEPTAAAEAAPDEPSPTPEVVAVATPVAPPTPAPTARPVATPRPTPTPEATPSPAATPAPTPEPTPEPADAAPGGLSVALLGFAGTVEVAGQAPRDTPTGPMRVPSGLRTVRLRDLHGGLLATVQVEIRAGETSRCAWRMSDGSLVRVPDSEGSPCRVR